MDYYNFLISKENVYLKYILDCTIGMEKTFNDLCDTRDFKLSLLLSNDLNLEKNLILKRISNIKNQINLIFYNIGSYQEDRLGSSNSQLVIDLNKISYNVEDVRKLVENFVAPNVITPNEISYQL